MSHSNITSQLFANTPMTLWSVNNSEALAHQFSEAFAQSEHSMLIICPDAQSAEILEQQIAFFLDARLQQAILHFPDWETLPYDVFSPSQDIISERLRCLVELPQDEKKLVVTSINTLTQPIPPQSFIKAHTLMLKKGQIITPESLLNDFAQSGYQAVENVYEHGEFVSRGSIIDVFPMGSDKPIRIDFLDDEIDSLRFFEVESQLSDQPINEISILPANEFPLDGNACDEFIDNWHLYFDEAFDDTRSSPVYQDVKSGIASAGLEYYLPLFFEHQHACLLDYLPKDCRVAYHQQCHDSAQKQWQDINQRFDERRHNRNRPLVKPSDLFCSTESIFQSIKDFTRSQWHLAESSDGNTIVFPYQSIPELHLDNQADEPLARLKQYIEQAQQKIVICSQSDGRRVAFEEFLAQHKIAVSACDDWQQVMQSSEPVVVCTAPFLQGFSSDDYQLSLISEDHIFGEKTPTQSLSRRKKTNTQEATLRHFSELKDNSAVVHIEHGVGLYRGLIDMEIDGKVMELMHIEYADNTSLYVPVSSLHLIHRYQSKEDEKLRLDKLGNDTWSKNKRKAAEKIYDAASELLDTYAKREMKEGYAFSLDDDQYQRFCNEFAFTETADQSESIRQIIKDMKSNKPMDRLVCGDVGFGKTEVAMRAAFIAAHDGKQVAVLAPTTLLAQQHYENFRDRFSNWPVKIQVLSRFNTAKETQAIKESLQEGQTDIIIGTHKLLQNDIQFSDLGLMIVDEEHRFGVRQKERMKSIKANIDLLTLTATPIPRTLNMSLHAIRDLSLITTPPAKRLSVKTFVRPYESATIKEAILRELLRGGQVFYVHNEVKTMPIAVEELQALIPEARISFAHGQMNEKQLEKIMSDFYHKRSNILVCSTIIETGIDIPSANTIIINRADKFGLAQLHQLRGRVGRSHHQAYAYLFTPEHGKISKDAEKRLTAIQEASDLGAGFMLAQHDLEIRGAGELLGEEQSGQIEKIGFSLYMDLLEETIESLRQGKIPDIDTLLDQACEVNLNIPALIPEDYLNDPHNRLVLYKRIANAKSTQDLKQIKIEMINRFGLLSEEINWLFEVTQIKLEAIPLGIEKITANAKQVQLHFSKHTKVDGGKIISLVQENPQHFRMKSSMELVYLTHESGADERIEHTKNLLKQLCA